MAAPLKSVATKTFVTKPGEVKHNWIEIDASDAVVGRLAAFIATRLRGKHKPDYTPHVDGGDHVVVTNVEKVAFKGKKRTDKIYYWHTGYPGGIKERSMDKILDGNHPERVLYRAVKRMLPKESSLARAQLRKLHLYAGSAHKHEAQSPEKIDFLNMNDKNKG